MSGNPKVAAAGRLTIAVSGPHEAFERARPYLEVLGSGVTYVGEGDRGRLVKICPHARGRCRPAPEVETIPLGTANVVRAGGDVTVVAMGKGVPDARAAADALMGRDRRGGHRPALPAAAGHRHDPRLRRPH